MTLREYQATINMNMDKIYLKSGVICSFSNTTCTGKLGREQSAWIAMA